MGVESKVLSRGEIIAVAPYLGPHVIGGSFLECEGSANPLLVTPAHSKAAVRHGARLFTDAPARAITRDSDGGFVVETGRGAFRARQIISATGAWTAELGRMVGLKIPVTGAAGQVIVTEGRPPIMRDHLLQHVCKGLTLKQSQNGTFIIGGGWPGSYDRLRGRCVPLLDSIVGNCWVATRTVPQIAHAQLIRSWSGMGSSVPDGLPIIGESSVVKGFHVLYAPLGFTMGPICGRVFAENFLNGDATVPVAPYTPDRFQ
jgi:glycine/D-amino acid oxidase-like deaminating enzyme